MGDRFGHRPPLQLENDPWTPRDGQAGNGLDEHRRDKERAHVFVPCRAHGQMPSASKDTLGAVGAAEEALACTAVRIRRVHRRWRGGEEEEGDETGVEGLREEDRARFRLVHRRDRWVAFKVAEQPHEHLDGLVDDDDEEGGDGGQHRIHEQVALGR